jgi:hypothetical protein
MSVSPLLRKLAALAPMLFPAASLHRLGLSAMATRDYHAADTILERAALACRSEYQLERLACVRVHQLMARALAKTPVTVEASWPVERALCRLEWIEAVVPPFESIDARSALAAWAASAHSPLRAQRALQPSLFDRAA